MITFAEARRKAEQAVGTIERGTLYADTKGWQDKRAYAVNVGAEEFIVDNDLAYALTDTPLVLVDKATGQAIVRTYLDDPDRFDRMTEVNDE